MSEQTEEIRRRLENAGLSGDLRVEASVVARGKPAKVLRGNFLVAEFPECLTPGGTFLHTAGAHFLKHAPTDLAFLLTENERLEREVAGLRGEPGDGEREAASEVWCDFVGVPRASGPEEREFERLVITIRRANFASQAPLRTALNAAGRVIEAERRLRGGEGMSRAAEREWDEAELAYAEAMKGVK